jgi:hypothetical protein
VGLFSLLGHKQKLEQIDLELFDVLGKHGGAALYLTRHYGDTSESPSSQRRDASTMPPSSSQ